MPLVPPGSFVHERRERMKYLFFNSTLAVLFGSCRTMMLLYRLMLLLFNVVVFCFYSFCMFLCLEMTPSGYLSPFNHQRILQK